MADAELINTLSQYLKLAPIEKQVLLERPTPCEQCAALIDLLEMRLLDGDAPGPPCNIQ